MASKYLLPEVPVRTTQIQIQMEEDLAERVRLYCFKRRISYGHLVHHALAFVLGYPVESQLDKLVTTIIWDNVPSEEG